MLEQLQQFGKPTWHPSNFGKTRKIGLQQFDKPTWQNSPRHAYICTRRSWLLSVFHYRWEGEKEIKNYVKLLEKNFFFTCHFFLEVVKTQDLPSKI
jgi:hypothetical protein